jgi:hypothetical protein
MRRSAALFVVLLVLGACGSGVLSSGSGRPGTQQFTRSVPAVPRQLIRAGLEVFGRYGIPIAESDEPNGRVRTMSVNLRAMTNRFATAPLSCVASTPRDEPAQVQFDLQVRRTDQGSAVTLEAERKGGSGCVVRTEFISSLLSEIEREAGQP